MNDGHCEGFWLFGACGVDIGDDKNEKGSLLLAVWNAAWVCDCFEGSAELSKAAKRSADMVGY